MLSSVVRFDVFEFDFTTQALRKSGDLVPLSPQAARLLAIFVREHGTLLTHEALEKRLWPDTPIVPPNGIRRCLTELRLRLGDKPMRNRPPRFIATERAIGYRFIAPVAPVGEPVGDEPALSETPARLEASASVVEFPALASAPRVNWWRHAAAGAILVGLLVVLAKAALASAYGVAIGAVVMLAVFFATLSNTRAALRAGLAALTIGAMAFIASASTLPYVVSHVVNARTLPPAIVYPAVTGLKFIPLWVLVLAFWVLFAFFDDDGFGQHRWLRRFYLFLGPGFLVATSVFLVQASADYQVYRTKIPGSVALFVGYGLIFAVNAIVWFWGYRLFNRETIGSPKQVFLLCLGAYLPIAFGAYFVDQTYNNINQAHLDLRRPAAYKAENPDVLKHLQDVLPPAARDEIGAGLASLLQDPKFEQVLRTQPFYKQNFDEAFQVGPQAVMFGYRKDASSFEIIRFPKELADALRFEPLAGNL